MIPLPARTTGDASNMRSARLFKKSCEYSIAALNVRQFKFINEIFGSRAADELLCHIRKVIVENVRAGGILLPQLRGSVLSLPARYRPDGHTGKD